MRCRNEEKRIEHRNGIGTQIDGTSEKAGSGEKFVALAVETATCRNASRVFTPIQLCPLHRPDHNRPGGVQGSRVCRDAKWKLRSTAHDGSRDGHCYRRLHTIGATAARWTARRPPGSEHR